MTSQPASDTPWPATGAELVVQLQLPTAESWIRVRLAGGILAGPLFLTVSYAQAATLGWTWTSAVIADLLRDTANTR
jgi:hypothetical protein